MDKDEGAQMLRCGLFSCQVCMPKHWTDEQAKAFADRENLCGTSSGWFVRGEGSELLCGDPARNQCAERAGYVHVMLDA